jgi:NTP pyrophosphatase (non-canonical NTP hydrolase)
MKDIQGQVNDWVEQYKIGYWEPLAMVARLSEEVGEVAREVNHRYGPKKKKSAEDNTELADELGDVIFTVACIANSLGIDLDEAFARVMAKLYARDKDRWEKKSPTQ